MIENFISEKISGKTLTIENYYEVADHLIKYGEDKTAIKFFLSVDSFGMSKKEALFFALAIRDSGRVINYNQTILEKHSTGGVGDSTSLVMIPLLACMGYKVIKTTARSLVFTNGSSDKFRSIPNFKVQLTDAEIQNVLSETNACVLSHNGDICPVDTVLYSIMEHYGLYNNINLLASSIAGKKLASGAKVVLVDVKYGASALIKKYSEAKKLARVLRYIFKKCGVKSTIVISNTKQTIGEAIGNAVEVVDALNVLQGKKCLLRDISIIYASEMIFKASPKLNKKDVIDQLNVVLDSGDAFKKFLDIVRSQGGDYQVLQDAKLFNPYNSVNFLASKDGYVATIDSLLLGEFVRRLCKDTHDNNIGVVLRVKIGDFVKKDDIILSVYYKEEEDLERYKKAIAGCITLNDKRVKPAKVIKRIIR